jgi:hypothetical protein
MNKFNECFCFYHWNKCWLKKILQSGFEYLQVPVRMLKTTSRSLNDEAVSICGSGFRQTMRLLSAPTLQHCFGIKIYISFFVTYPESLSSEPEQKPKPHRVATLVLPKLLGSMMLSSTAQCSNYAVAFSYCIMFVHSFFLYLWVCLPRALSIFPVHLEGLRSLVCPPIQWDLCIYYDKALILHPYNGLFSACWGGYPTYICTWCKGGSLPYTGLCSIFNTITSFL